MAVIVTKPQTCMPRRRLCTGTRTGELLDEFLKRATLDCHYMELEVGRLPGLGTVIDDNGSTWCLSRLMVGVVMENPSDRSLTFTDLRTPDSYERKRFVDCLKRELASVALCAQGKGAVYVELEKCYELRGIAAAQRPHNKFGRTSSYAVVGVEATLFHLSEAASADDLGLICAELTKMRSSILVRERTFDDCDANASKELLDWLLTGDKDVDLESLQDDRRNWHQYLQGLKMAYEAIRQHGLTLAKQG